MTLIDLTVAYGSDERRRELLERLRWPNGPTCPRCEDSTPVRLSTNDKILYCRKCDYQFSVTTGTIFHDSHLALIKWFTVVLLLCEAKKESPQCRSSARSAWDTKQPGIFAIESERRYL